MERWRTIRSIPLVLRPKFYPADPSLARRVLLGALDEGSDVADLVHAGLSAVWADERDIADPDTMRRLADAAGLDRARLLAGADTRYLRARELAQGQDHGEHEARDEEVARRAELRRAAPAQPAATRVSAMPIIVRIVPVTTGGKKRISRPPKGTTASPNSPATITVP